MVEKDFHYKRRRLENDLVALELFEPKVHATKFIKVLADSPDDFRYLAAFSPMENEAEFMSAFYEPFVSSNLATCMYAIIDKKTPPGDGNAQDNYAGTISLVATNPTNAATEIGIGIFPAFHRTHVTSNAVGLLLQWVLDPPSMGGLGLRRVEWQSHAENLASRRTAERMGFQLEGVLRWERVIPPGKIGVAADELGKRNGTKEEPKGRHTAIYSIVWDEWDEKRPNVIAQMERKR